MIIQALWAQLCCCKDSDEELIAFAQSADNQANITERELIIKRLEEYNEDVPMAPEQASVAETAATTRSRATTVPPEVLGAASSVVQAPV